jgi:hypothetical protein
MVVIVYRICSVATIDFVCEPKAEEAGHVKSYHPVTRPVQSGGSCFLSWPCEIFLLLYHATGLIHFPISKKVHGRGDVHKSQWNESCDKRARGSQLHPRAV